MIVCVYCVYKCMHISVHVCTSNLLAAARFAAAVGAGATPDGHIILLRFASAAVAPACFAVERVVALSVS